MFVGCANGKGKKNFFPFSFSFAGLYERKQIQPYYDELLTYEIFSDKKNNFRVFL